MFKMSNETYDILKIVAQYGLPGVAVILAIAGKATGNDSLSSIADYVMTADLALGGVLGISTKDYRKMLNEIDESINDNGQ